MFEKVLLQNLVNNHTYGKAFLAYVKPTYFSLYESKNVYKYINSYFDEYQKIPHWNEILITANNDTNLNEKTFSDTIELIEEIKTTDDQYNIDWLQNETKKWIRNKAFELVIVESADKLQNDKSIDDMMDKVKDVFSINFNESIGLNFKKGAEKQLQFYRQKRRKFESNINGLNLICDGGVEPKTLNILMAPTNTGKTSAMVHLASGYLRAGYKILYITCEMSEENIRQRMEANFLDIPINDIPLLPDALYLKRMQEIDDKFLGNIYIKEYPTASANCNHFRALLDNLATKEEFVPDIVIIDYLNILLSTRVTQGNSYGIVKAIAEEVRGLAGEYDVAVWTATQSNREGDGASDLNLSNSSDSYGVPMTCDLEIGLIQPQSLFEQQKQIWKCLKTRYSRMKHYKFGVYHYFDTCKVIDIADGDDGLNSEQNDIERMKVNNRERMQGLGVEIDFD